jgi:hypothetical protein
VKKLALALAVCLYALPAGAERPVTVDAVAVRFLSPDIGGVTHPRFITRREVAFEARLLALEEDPSGTVQPRHVRAAIEAHVAETILGQLPLEPAADPRAIARAADLFRAGLLQRIGGEAALDRAEKAEGIAPSEFDAMTTREARAAVYLDRISPLFAVDEDRLRETYRTTSHPFRGRPFDAIRGELARWLVLETFRAAEQAYLQASRSRITLVYDE